LAPAVKLIFAHFPVLKIVNMISPITYGQKYDTPSKNFMGGGGVTTKMNVRKYVFHVFLLYILRHKQPSINEAGAITKILATANTGRVH
jgi:hypothetical protein